MLSIEKPLGFRFRIVEKCGKWEGILCGKEAYITCNQGGEVIQNCTKRSIVYENICLECNPTAKAKGEVVPQASHPSIYVGESSRSLAERSEDHWKSFSGGNPDNHILKHHQIHHGGVGSPNFIMRMVRQYPTALRRQVGEAVRIKRRGEAVLNSKAEYNRCSITRLTLPDRTLLPTIQQEEEEKPKEDCGEATWVQI